MREAFVSASVNVLVKNGIIEESQIELYRFGINQLFLLFVNTATMIVMGVLCGMIWESILFSVAYIPLRQYAGGYHAKTPLRCYWMSLLMILSVLELMKYVELGLPLSIIFIAIAGLTIWFKAPVDCENKRLNEKEKSIFGKRARMILAAEICIFAGCSLFDAGSITECLVMALVIAAGMVWIGIR